MSILLVGGEFLGDMVERMMGKGATEVTHWTGRNQKTLGKDIPKGTDMVVVFTDYINHTLCRLVKAKCKKSGCPIAYSKRSWVHLEKAIEAFEKCKGCDGCNCGKKFN